MYCYFVTCCTEGRSRIFTTHNVVDGLRCEFLRTSRERHFAILADVWMPDHLHLLIEGTSTDSEFKPMMKTARQRASIWFTRLGYSHRPWQDGFYEHVLREDEERIHYVEYMIMNPVRAAIVEHPQTYAFTYLCPEYESFFFGVARN